MAYKSKIIILISVVIVIAVTTAIIIFNPLNKVKNYSITFTTDNKVKSIQSVKSGELIIKPDIPKKEGFEFVEWLYNGKTFDFNTYIEEDIELKASWKILTEKKQFTIKFNSEGGTLISDQIIKQNTLVEKPNNPSKDGYVFKGWYTQNILFDFSKVVTEHKILFARWEKITEKVTQKVKEKIITEKTTVQKVTTNKVEFPTTTPIQTTTKQIEKYTIKFNTYEGSEIPNIIITAGDKITKPESPIKKGYLFENWYLQDEVYDFNLIPNTSLTLEAVFIPIKYYIKYDANNAVGHMNSTECTYDLNCVLQNNTYQNSGYTFAGWTKIPNGEVIYSNEAEVKNISKNNKEEITLYAKWEVIDYAIEYDLQGGSASNSLTYNVETKDFVLVNPVKEGYIFAGWIGSNGNVPELEVNILKGTTKNLTFTATWTPINYYIKYNSTSGSGTMQDTLCTYDVNCRLRANSFTRRSYNFIGWALTPNGNIIYDNNQIIKNLTVDNNKEITLYARWNRR